MQNALLVTTVDLFRFKLILVHSTRPLTMAVHTATHVFR